MWSERSQVAAGPSPVEAEPFCYRQAPGNGAGEPDGWLEEGPDPEKASREAQRLAFEQGRQQGEAQARAEAQAQLAAERRNIQQALERFKEERSAYFARIESEVVHLALAIARKILHREAQIDPLLLTGMVHVALEKLDAGTRVRMRAHPGDVHLWTEYFSQNEQRQAHLEFIGDATLRPGECVLETESGGTQMSLEGQLKEIEQGFFDLLEHRPVVG